MNVIRPISVVGERDGREPQYMSVGWNFVPDQERAKALKDIALPESMVHFEFTRDEALKLQSWGRFNVPQIEGFDVNLLGVTTQTFVDNEDDIMINLLARFRQNKQSTLPDNTVVGTIFPSQLTDFLDEVILTGPGPVSR